MSAARGPADLRALLGQAAPISNAWLQLGSALAAEILAEAGWDVLTLDQQHGFGGQAEMTAVLTAARAAGIPALVRVPVYDYGLVGRALDAGAQGVIVPMVESAEHAQRLVEAVKYPPQGRRSYGPYRARLMLEGDYFGQANGWTIACGQIETKLAADNIEEILSVPGFDMICLGPNDLAISMSGGKDRDIRAPAVLDAIEHVRRRAAEKGVITFIFANDVDYARRMKNDGWQMITIATEANWLADAARALLAAIKGA